MTFKFHLPSSGAPSVSPPFSAGWNDTSQADRIRMLGQGLEDATSPLTNKTVSITSSASADNYTLVRQYVSDPLPAGHLAFYKGELWYVVLRASESDALLNVLLTYGLFTCSEDGSIIRSTILAVGAAKTGEVTLDAAPSTVRAFAAPTYAPLVGAGDRIVLEIGVDAQVPTASGTATLRFGYATNTADFANTTGLTTDLNPWSMLNYVDSGLVQNRNVQNYMSVKTGDGMWVGDRVR